MDENWRLESLEIEFKKGYSFNQKEIEKHDRYEGKIEFKNNEQESFTFKIKPDMAQKYLDLIANDVVNSANDFGEKLKQSLGLV